MPMSGTQSASDARVLADRRMSTDSRSLLEGMDQQREQVLEDASSKGLVLPPSSSASGYRYVQLKERAFHARLEATPTRASYTDGPYSTPEAAALSAVIRLDACGAAMSAAKPYRGAVTAEFPGFNSFEARVTLQADPGCPSKRRSLGRAFKTAPEAALHRAKRIRELEADGVRVARARLHRTE